MAEFRTVTTEAVFIPEVWSKEVNKATESELVMANLVWRVDSLVAPGGDKVHIPNVANMTTLDKTAETPITYQINTNDEVTLDINVHKYVANKIEDIAAVQASYPLRSIYTEKMGYAIAKAIDTSLTSLYSGLSQVVDCGSALTDTLFITAMEYLDIADVPRSDRAFVLHSEGLADLRGISKYTEFQFTGDKGVATSGSGAVASVYGVPVHISNNVVETAGTPSHIHNMLFHKKAFVAALQQAPKTESQYSIDDFATKIAIHTIYGVAENRDNFAVAMDLHS